MEITIARLSDLDQLSRLFDGYRVFYEQTSDPEAASSFIQQRLAQDQSICLLCKNRQGQCIGFTQLYPSYSSVSLQHTWILNDLYVDPDFRGLGAGKALLLAAQEYAKSDGAKGLTLETAIDNPAQKLYESLGWEKDTDVFHYTWKV